MATDTLFDMSDGEIFENGPEARRTPSSTVESAEGTPARESESPEDLIRTLERYGYLADEGLATVVFLALHMGRPLFLEGEAGVGKTEIAKVLARWTGGELLRLQCYDGIDASQALYEWDYSPASCSTCEQLKRPARGAPNESSKTSSSLSAFSSDDRFFAAIEDSGHGPVPILLIDEIDRADDEFEAFLLEILSDYTVTVPELGTFAAGRPPVVVITSNRTRDVHDALKRRCLYHWVEHPTLEREVAIVELRVPEASRVLAHQVAAAVAALRKMGLYKVPGVAETIDWTQALLALGTRRLDHTSVERTLGSVVKYREDAERVRRRESLSSCALPAAQVEMDHVSEVAIGFGRALRENGLDAPVSAVICFARALAALGLDRPAGVYWAGHASFVRDPEDTAPYASIFAAYFGEGGGALEAVKPQNDLIGRVDEAESSVRESSDDMGGVVHASSYSPLEALRKKDFAACSPAEIAEIYRLMDSMRRLVALRRARRKVVTSHRHGSPDLRRTVRRSLRTGGESTALLRRGPGVKERPIVLLVDVSGSMESYARAFLHFAHAVVICRRRVEAFTLGTRLTRITRELSWRDGDAAIVPRVEIGHGHLRWHPTR